VLYLHAIYSIFFLHLYLPTQGCLPWALVMRHKFKRQCVNPNLACCGSRLLYNHKAQWLTPRYPCEAYCVGMTCCASKCHRLLCCPIKQLINFSNASYFGGRNFYNPYNRYCLDIVRSFPLPSSTCFTCLLPLLSFLCFVVHLLSLLCCSLFALHTPCCNPSSVLNLPALAACPKPTVSTATLSSSCYPLYNSFSPLLHLLLLLFPFTTSTSAQFSVANITPLFYDSYHSPMPSPAVLTRALLSLTPSSCLEHFVIHVDHLILTIDAAQEESRRRCRGEQVPTLTFCVFVSVCVCVCVCVRGMVVAANTMTATAKCTESIDKASVPL
jgi:hypothetical protein